MKSSPKPLKPLAVGVEYDEEFHDVLKLFTWYISDEGTNKYAKAPLPRLFGGKSVRMHHMIMYWLCGYRRVAGRHVDHIDGNGLNNRRSNLRLVTCGQNHKNRKKITGTSKYKGVSWNRAGKKWVAQIRDNGKQIPLGYFHSEVDAAKAYNKASKERHGFPPHFGTKYFRTPRIWFKEINGQPLWDQWTNPTYYDREAGGWCREYMAVEEHRELLAEAVREAREKLNLAFAFAINSPCTCQYDFERTGKLLCKRCEIIGKLSTEGGKGGGDV